MIASNWPYVDWGRSDSTIMWHYLSDRTII